MKTDILISLFHKLSSETEALSDQLILTVKAGRIYGEEAKSCYDVCAITKPEIRKALSELQFRGYSSDLRREFMRLCSSVRTTSTFLSKKLHS